ncbi:MAG: hypothetical protein ACYTG5_05250 [Planctomycetota bacterium]|jgi:hypothetical protein
MRVGQLQEDEAPWFQTLGQKSLTYTLTAMDRFGPAPFFLWSTTAIVDGDAPFSLNLEWAEKIGEP